MGNRINVDSIPAPGIEAGFEHDPRKCLNDCCRFDVNFILDNAQKFNILPHTMNVLLDLKQKIQSGQYKHGNDLNIVAMLRCTHDCYYYLLKTQKQLKQQQQQQQQLKINNLQCKIELSLDDWDQKIENINNELRKRQKKNDIIFNDTFKYLIEINGMDKKLDTLLERMMQMEVNDKVTELQSESISIQHTNMMEVADIRSQISEMDKHIGKKKELADGKNSAKSDDGSLLVESENMELKQGNVVKMKSLMMERETEEREILMKKILDDVNHLKENFENRTIEVEENINKFGKINLIVEKIESSMNFEIVQGYEKKKEKEEREREFQVVVSKGIELLNTYLHHGIHGNHVNNINIHDLTVDFETHDIQLNGVEHLEIVDIEIMESSHQNISTIVLKNGCVNNQELKELSRNDVESGKNIINVTALSGTIIDLNPDGKFLCDIGNDCDYDCHDYLTSKFNFFTIDDGG